MSWLDDLGAKYDDVAAGMKGVAADASAAKDAANGYINAATSAAKSALAPLGALSNDLTAMRLEAAGLAKQVSTIPIVGGMLGGMASKAVGSLTSLSSAARLPVVGASWLQAGSANQCLAPGSGSSSDDWRIKVKASPAVPFMQSAILAPLVNDTGVTFPILPQITVTHTAKYSTQSLTHSNYAAHSYEGSEIADIAINGEFVVQNITDGQYLLAAIYFFRSCTKMFWGADALAGTPPPMLWLDGFGTHYFPHVPCVLKSFTHTIGTEVDYIEIPDLAGGKTRLPTQSTIQIALQPIYSRAKVANFSLNDFAAGKLVGGTGGFI